MPVEAIDPWVAAPGTNNCANCCVPSACLTEIIETRDCGSAAPDWFGAAIPIASRVGDQQLRRRQGCLTAARLRHVRGRRVHLTHAGTTPRTRGRCCRTADANHGQRNYALEGSLFVAGTLIQCCRQARLSARSGNRARPDRCQARRMTIVPAFAGLGQSSGKHVAGRSTADAGHRRGSWFRRA